MLDTLVTMKTQLKIATIFFTMLTSKTRICHPEAETSFSDFNFSQAVVSHHDLQSTCLEYPPIYLLLFSSSV